MKRREFVVGLAGAAAWSATGHAQQPEAMRRIGVLNTISADDAHGQERIGAFLQGLHEAGWIIGSNVHVDQRWAVGTTEVMHKQAAELVELAPDVIVATGGAVVRPLLELTRTV